jgi:hypothetical protein
LVHDLKKENFKIIKNNNFSSHFIFPVINTGKITFVGRIVVLKNFIAFAANPRINVHEIGDKAWNVALDYGSISLNYVFGEHFRVVELIRDFQM